MVRHIQLHKGVNIKENCVGNVESGNELLNLPFHQIFLRFNLIDQGGVNDNFAYKTGFKTAVSELSTNFK